MNAPVKPSQLIKGATGDWEVVIGLEIHAQISSKAKLFSGASTAFGGEPNSQVSLVDMAMPGMLPVINEECVRQAIRSGLGLNAKINLRSVFDRKNYFYPDLPQGYQISQYKSPIVGEGEIVVDLPNGESVAVGIERLHLEQDPAKMLHDKRPSESLSCTWRMQPPGRLCRQGSAKWVSSARSSPWSRTFTKQDCGQQDSTSSPLQKMNASGSVI